MDNQTTFTDISNSIVDVSNQQALFLKKKEEYVKKRKEEIINLIRRQTNYSKEEIIEKLEGNNYNYIPILNEYNGRSIIEENQKNTTNQQIYSQIRNLMDDGAKRFRLQQEKAENYKKWLEKNKNEQENKSEN